MAEALLPYLYMVLLGKSGVGKSTSANTILGEETFQVLTSLESTTRNIQMNTVTNDGRITVVYDTPGMFHTEITNENVKNLYQTVFHLLDSAPVVFLLVIAVGRFTPEDGRAVAEIQKSLGEERLRHTWILFTGGDALERDEQSIEEFIEETLPLKNAVQRVGNRYHVFNNRRKDQRQVKALIDKIDQFKQSHCFTLGRLVQMKASVKEPKYGWGGVSHRSVGKITNVDHLGQEVIVDFPEQSGFLGVFSEMESASNNQKEPYIKVGDYVRVKSSTTMPIYGWGLITDRSVGKIISMLDDNVTVDFPEQSGWLGMCSEMEHVFSDETDVDRLGQKGIVNFPEQCGFLGVFSEMESASNDQKELPHFKVGDRVRLKGSQGVIHRGGVAQVTGHKLVVKFPGQPERTLDPSEVELATQTVL